MQDVVEAAIFVFVSSRIVKWHQNVSILKTFRLDSIARRHRNLLSRCQIKASETA